VPLLAPLLINTTVIASTDAAGPNTRAPPRAYEDNCRFRLLAGSASPPPAFAAFSGQPQADVADWGRMCVAHHAIVAGRQALKLGRC
jgi:hypothetical protein